MASTEPTGWRQKFVADDGTVLYDDEAIAAMSQDWENGGFAGLERDVGHGFETQDEWRRRTQPTHVKATHRRRPHGRAARPASNAKRRGSRRQSGSSPPAPDDPDESDLGHSCPICGASLDGLRSDATYCGSSCRREASRRRRRESAPVDGHEDGSTSPGPQRRAERRLIPSPRAGTSDQPKPRIPATSRIIAELDCAENVPLPDERFMGLFWSGRPTRRMGFARGRTYVELARAIYETAEPTAAQVKTVQRAAKRLVEAGRIERGHRGRDGFVVRRLPTEPDIRCRADVERRARERLAARAEAEANATAYPVDTGFDGIVEVPVEP